MGDTQACRQAAGHPSGARPEFGAGGHESPGFRLHALRGPLKGRYAVWVSDNWRVTFRFEDGSAVDVDYVDYH